VYGNPAVFIRMKQPQLNLFVDGTFRIVPKQFQQLLIIMYYDSHTDLYIPAFYILLTARNEKIYKRCLQAVKDVLNFELNVATITCDFEQALQNAVKGLRNHSLHYVYMKLSTYQKNRCFSLSTGCRMLISLETSHSSKV
jgi:hypothetical protein